MIPSAPSETRSEAKDSERRSNNKNHNTKGRTIRVWVLKYGFWSNGVKKKSQTHTGALSLPETSLFQLHFPALLRESTRAAERGGKAISNRVATNTIAVADVLARAKLDRHVRIRTRRVLRVHKTYLQDPTDTKVVQPAVNAAFSVSLFTAGRKRGASGLQTLKVLLVVAEYEARTPGGEAAYRDVKSVRGREKISIRTVARVELFYVQRPHASKQSNRPKVQSRFPSGPTGRFRPFLLPPATIGTVPCEETNTQKCR